MKSLVSFLLLALFVLVSRSLAAQKKCGYRIDTAKILENKNLDEFLAELKFDSFKITNTKKAIPRFIKKQLKCFEGEFRIANPDKPFNATDFIMRNLPDRKLVFLAKSDDLFVMQYLRGGRGLSLQILLIKFSKGKIVDLWKGIGRWEIETIPDLVYYLESYRNKEWGLNTNAIYF